MSESDPIVEEVRRIRDAHAAKFNYDPDAIFRDIKERERMSGRNYVSFADERVLPNPATQPVRTSLSAPGDVLPLPAAPGIEL